MGTVTEELIVAELATLAKFASPDSLLAKLLRIYHAQTELIAELRECLDVETAILPDAEGKPTPEFIEALTDALREYGEEPAAPVACDCDETVGFTHYADGSSTARCRKCGHSWPMASQPAAPEPSADQCRLGWKREYARAESAEAKLAAVREVVNGRFSFGQMVLRIRSLLTPAPGPVTKD